MVDAHVHFLHNTTGIYTLELLESIVKYASEAKMSEIYLLTTIN